MWLTEQQTMIRDTARRFVQQRLAPNSPRRGHDTLTKIGGERSNHAKLRDLASQICTAA